MLLHLLIYQEQCIITRFFVNLYFSFIDENNYYLYNNTQSLIYYIG